MAFATSPRLPKQWQRYVKANFNEKEQDQIARELGEGYNTDGEVGE